MATATKFNLSTARLESTDYYPLETLQKEWDLVRSENAALGKELDANYKQRDKNRHNVHGDKSKGFSKKANQYDYAKNKALYEETEVYLDLVKVQLQNVKFLIRTQK